MSVVEEMNVQESIQKLGISKNFELKTPKGTRDYGPFDMAIREGVFNTITSVFKRHGAVTIDTPVFELKEVLTGKYGEDSKLIYDLQDQGGELCSLRYDLTVPFARFLAMNKEYKHMKRYHIAKVYRRDNPAMTKGRYREFYQCDFDIAGEFDVMVPDAEILCIVRQVLSELDVGEFKIKLNHRLLLDGLFEIAGVSADQFRPVSSAIDKLDKLPWADVRQELVEVKGIPEPVADKIGQYVKLHGEPRKIMQTIEQNHPELMKSARVEQAMKELWTLFEYCDALSATQVIELDLSLARGLDYYTGVIFEAVSLNSAVGSIAAGGRYDDLVGMFDRKNNRKIPCVGFSVGVERIFSIIEAKATRKTLGHVSVYVASIGDSFMSEKMLLAQKLWDSGISCEYNYKKKAKLSQQFDACDEKGAEWIVIVAEDELKQGFYKLRSMKDKSEVNVPKDDIVNVLSSKLRSCQ